MPDHVQYWPLNSLKPWEGNYRRGDVDAIAKSIQRFGFNGALRVKDETVYAGNHALAALQQMHGHGQSMPKGIVADPAGGWLVPVIDIGHLSEVEAEAFAIADNHTQELGTQDSEQLTLLLEQIRVQDESLLPATSFDQTDLEQLLAVVGASAPDAGSEIECPDPQDPESTRFGQVRPSLGDKWQLGEHLLICGDSTDPVTVHGLEAFDLLWTDPPYGVEYVGKTGDALTIANDGAAGLEPLLESSFRAANSVMRPGASFYICHSAGPNQTFFGAATKRVGWHWHQSLIWLKNGFVLGHSDYHYRHEPLIYGWKPGAIHTWNGGRDKDSVLAFDKPLRNGDHPTTKPVELIELCLHNSSNAGDRVLDLFGGSGTTLLACERTGRKATLIEIEPKYCEVILRRWEEATKREPKRL